MTHAPSSIPPPAPPPPPVDPPVLIAPPLPQAGLSRREVSFLLFVVMPGGLTSLVVHLVVLILLGLYAVAQLQVGGEQLSIVVAVEQEAAEEMAPLEVLTVPIEPLDVAEEFELQPADLTSLALEGESLLEDLPAADELLELPAPQTISLGGLSTGSRPDGGLPSRAERRRSALRHGATPESENAVNLALLWLVRHQREDGSWTLQHAGPNACGAGSECPCENPSGRDDPMAATALSLLPLLGAGHTHLDGEHREAVRRGLQFLILNQQVNGSLLGRSRKSGGTMYSHGLATLALCEALAMTRYYGQRAPSDEFGIDLVDGSVSEEELATAAQAALRFIEYAQHKAGGWRYQPNQAGDTSVLGWQLMALKSGSTAGLHVSSRTIAQAAKFLDSVCQDSEGSVYGYTRGRRRGSLALSHPLKATTPIGLLCRMYTGWERTRPGLERGVQRINRWAKPRRGLYYYYYATLVMHQYGGPQWEQWNNWARDYLVGQQDHAGSQRGSWYLDGPHDNAGRLYCTAMATMTLEVYYRYLPIYKRPAVEVAQGK